jgi:hypothetical protein
MHATYPTNVILQDLIVVKIYGEEYILWNLQTKNIAWIVVFWVQGRSAPRMEAARSFKTFVTTYKSTRSHNPPWTPWISKTKIRKAVRFLLLQTADSLTHFSHELYTAERAVWVWTAELNLWAPGMHQVSRSVELCSSFLSPSSISPSHSPPWNNYICSITCPCPRSYDLTRCFAYISSLFVSLFLWINSTHSHTPSIFVSKYRHKMKNMSETKCLKLITNFLVGIRYHYRLSSVMFHRKVPEGADILRSSKYSNGLK